MTPSNLPELSIYRAYIAPLQDNYSEAGLAKITIF